MAARKSFQSTSQSQKETKLCASCGRSFGYQKRWEKTWEDVRYCSSSCRKDKFEKRDSKFEEAILRHLTEQKQFIDLAEIEKDFESENYRNLRERIRRAARRLVAKGKIDILQKGKVVEASTAKGPIEVRLK